MRLKMFCIIIFLLSLLFNMLSDLLTVVIRIVLFGTGPGRNPNNASTAETAKQRKSIERNHSSFQIP